MDPFPFSVLKFSWSKQFWGVLHSHNSFKQDGAAAGCHFLYSQMPAALSSGRIT